ncbi:CMP-N-acetylneuraminic acid synthetase [Campylobacter novaezeelandiae]|uniref:Acylneuraminate cytidylyltransferase family protein n=2 Tax=Campylobacter novaezeelandiae TaxID=2267891 RepID=A0A4Q9JVU0_9BACT|nr:acylneuraminate cytidylyltransferase family protein [Campylobacter novaezeelandiae]MBK1964452.1 acylneuraminate cytidylyltransferase family protein [Campylobacter novaezeelandiae]MBK1994144.1 acylneuraminate cytidylyltransferase family protein [Campylobacter novaezeelandiae]QWU80448.1 CMP-N-acetylneuraminic acid synthetase [Campylobacter novaezeelandiae]TBR80480.1 acylneuraminate cytidylyltransferase family protein [Campylobacter novaezeelandiae]
MSNKTLALIPARAGSKGIKNKNLALLANKPLVYHTIKAAKEATCIDKIVLSSDGDEILTYARSQGIDIIKRPKELSLDNTTSDKVILHTLEIYKTYENIILLQPTSPFRTSKHIDESFYHFIQKNANALISVCKCDNKILKAFISDEKGNLKGISNDDYPFYPRQELPNTYMSNGAIYILKVKEFLKKSNFLLKNTTYFEMDEVSSLDIDTLEDLKKANELLCSN